MTNAARSHDAAVAIRSATPADVDAIFAMIVGLAEYERAPEAVTGTPDLLGTALFGPDPAAVALIAEHEGEIAGFALLHRTFSTWECREGLWLEDLFVWPAHRRHGIGEALLRAGAALAVERGATRYGWTALDWNAPALAFYAKHGADVLSEWLIHRVSGDTIAELARGAK